MWVFYQFHTAMYSFGALALQCIIFVRARLSAVEADENAVWDIMYSLLFNKTKSIGY